MNNLNANASAFLWQAPTQQLPQQLQPQQLQPQTMQQPGVQSVQAGQLLHAAVVSQPRKFGGNKSNYNYVHGQSGPLLAAGNPAGNLMDGFGGNPNIYRKRQPINAYNPGCYQTNGKQWGSSASWPKNLHTLLVAKNLPFVEKCRHIISARRFC